MPDEGNNFGGTLVMIASHADQELDFEIIS